MSKRKIEEALRAKTDAWNGGSGISIDNWVANEGSFSLAAGYLHAFTLATRTTNGFVLNDSIVSDESCEQVRSVAEQRAANEFYIQDLQHDACADGSPNLFSAIGQALQRLWTAQLKALHPETKFVVDFVVPANPNDLSRYFVTFWQASETSVVEGEDLPSAIPLVQKES